VFAVVGVVIVAVIMGIMSMLRNPSNSDGSLDDDDPGPVPGAATSGSPEAAVQGYLEALAAGKAADALAYFATPAEDTTFLTDAVLAAGLAVNPITDIAVQDNQHDDTESAWIEATYSIGDQSVSGMFELADHGGSWLLEDDLAYVDLNFEYRQGVGMTLNGVSLDTVADRSKIEILPGTYTVAVSNPFLTVDGGVFVVEELDPFFDNDIAITLASDAAATLAAQATAALDACLLEKALPNSCGLGGGELEGGATPDLNTVVWSFTSGSSDFSTADFILDSYNPTKADAIINAELKIDVSDTAGDSYSGSERLSKLSVDFADPAAVRITIF
jgi:hypothetical protein